VRERARERRDLRVCSDGTACIREASGGGTGVKNTSGEQSVEGRSTCGVDALFLRDTAAKFPSAEGTHFLVRTHGHS
jgi:hypothetical protein